MPHIPSNDEILQLLDRLEEETADDLESEVLEFESWNAADKKNNLERAVESAVCFANALGGVIIFGVGDKATGRKQAITGCTGYNLNNWREHIYRNTKPSLTCEVEELPVAEGTLLVVRVPAAPTRPCGTTGGLFKVRIGKTRQPLDPAAFGEAREPPLSDEEQTLLGLAAEHTGEIQMHDLDQGLLIRVEGAQPLYDLADHEACARSVDALEGLVARGYVRHEGGILYSLKGSGWDEGRRLGAVSSKTRELIRRQALARFVREQERILSELPRSVTIELEQLVGSGMVHSSVAAGRVVECMSTAVHAIAKARVEAEFAALAEAGVSLDRARAELLKGEVSELVNNMTQQFLDDHPRLWRNKLGSFEGGVEGTLRERSEQIQRGCVRDIDIALRSELLKARKPTD